MNMNSSIRGRDWFAMNRIAIIAASIFVSNSAALAADSPCETRGHLRWEMPITPSDIGRAPERVFSREEFGLVDRIIDDGDRLSIRQGPDGDPALYVNVPRGENKRIGFEFDVFNEPGIQHGCLALKVQLQSGFDFATAKTKLGWGLWGGGATASAGGVPPELQRGWTVRNATNGKHGSKIYSYHLNRDQTRVDKPRCDPYGCMFGATSVGSGPLPSGRWFDVNLELRVNDEGRDNGYVRMWIDGEMTAEMQGLRFSDDRNWNIRGFRFTDMWGGNTADPANFSPRYQGIFYSDYRIYDMEEPVGGGEDPVSEVAQISPRGEHVGETVDFVWQPGQNIDQYQIKLVDDDLATLYYDNLTPAEADCGYQAGQCRVAGMNLPVGEYKWRLRYVIDGQKSSYIDSEFNVAGEPEPEPEEPGPIEIAIMEQVAPTGTIPQSEISFVWKAAEAVDGYDLKVIDRQTGTTLYYKTVTNDMAECGYEPGTCHYPAPELTPGEYQWNVRSVKVRTRSDFLKTGFVVEEPPQPTSTLAAISPSGDITDRTPSLTWRPETSADRYYVKVVDLDNGSQQEFGTAVATTTCTETECRINAPWMPRGNYAWMVRGIADGVKGDYERLRFRIR